MLQQYFRHDLDCIEVEPISTKGLWAWLSFRHILRVVVIVIHQAREYWMIYRWPGFLADVLFGLSPLSRSFSPLPSETLSLFLSLPVCRRSSLLAEGDGVGEEPNHNPRERLALYKSFNTLCTKHFPFYEYTKQLQLVLSGLAQTGHLAVNQTKPNWLVSERGEGRQNSSCIRTTYVPSEKNIRQGISNFIYRLLIY